MTKMFYASDQIQGFPDIYYFLISKVLSRSATRETTRIQSLSN